MSSLLTAASLLFPVLAPLDDALGLDAIPPELVDAVREATVGAGASLGFTETDLSGYRFPCRMPAFFELVADTFRFEEASRAIGDRFVGAKGLDELLEEAWVVGGFEIAEAEPLPQLAEDPLEALEIALDELWASQGETLPADFPLETLEALPADAVLPLARFLSAIPSCADAWARAVERVPAEGDELRTAALRYHEVGADTEALRLIEGQFDRAQGGRAAVELLRAAETLVAELEAARLTVRVDDVRLPTPFGDVFVGGRGKTEHGAEPALLVVDVSGDDRYLPGSACGSGAHPFCAVIDLRGDDEYLANGEPNGAGAGAGIAGIGVVIDVRGDDRWLASQYGAGFGLVGAGVVHDLEGNDRYVGDHLCQAVGLCGVGLLVDEAGEDEYELFCYGQGLGQPLGTGALIDRGGDDVYVARDDELRYPSAQTKEHNNSMAQGAGCGLRDDANKRYVCGGVGLLLDHEGNDTYRGAVFAQAVGYWYGLGLLFDLEGDDAYSAVWYGQSASAHFALSYQLDVEGDDRYTTAMSQSLGNGRDLSISVFRDERGDDRYFGPDRSLGCGDVVGVGLFLDADGRDAYELKTKVNVGFPSYQEKGHPEWRHEKPTVGVFLDLGRDRDEYGREGLADGTRWLEPGEHPGTKGIGIDDGP